MLKRLKTRYSQCLVANKTKKPNNIIPFTYLLVCELLCMNQERLLSTYMAQALSSFPSITSFRTSPRATPNAGSGWLS